MKNKNNRNILKTEMITLRISCDRKEEIKNIAKKHGKSMSQAIMDLIGTNGVLHDDNLVESMIDLAKKMGIMERKLNEGRQISRSDIRNAMR